MRGKFITFEGSEGCGKSTQSKLLYQYLKKQGYPALYIREPGGVKISEKIRAILLDCANTDMSDACETLLYMASRAQLVHQLIKPALRAGKVVVCDRFLDSTIAYQGFGLGIDIGFIKKLGYFATEGLRPDLTILLDLAVHKGLAYRSSCKDRIECRPLNYHRKVRQGYFKLASDQPARIKVVRVEKEKDLTQENVRKIVEKFLRRI